MAKTWPTLYRRTSTGAIQQWKVWVEGNTIFTEYGQVGGALQTTSKDAWTTNEGRSNERTPEQQAIFEANSMWEKRSELKYSTSIETAQEAQPILPMLAHKFEDHKHKINWKEGVYVEPKYDGCRALAYRDDSDKIVMTTRTGKTWSTLPHIVKALEEVIPIGSDIVLDGELYLHGVTFQSVTKLVKKQRPESLAIKYHVYDIISDEVEDQSDRIAWLDNFLLRNTSDYVKEQIVVVPAYLVFSELEVYNYQKKFVADGYEGAIVRLPNARYKMNGRSSDLLKVKSWQEDDFRIVGYEEGVGKFEGCVIWTCVTKEGKEFKCVPKGTLEDKMEWFENAESYIGKMLSVKYFEKSEDGIPRFPVGLGVKEDR